MKSFAALLLATALASALASPLAAEIAVFTDGRTLKLASYEVNGGRAMLDLSSGGALVVPMERIDRIVDDELIAEPAVIDELPGLFPRRDWRFDSTSRAQGPDNFLAIVFEAAETHDVDPALVAAVIRAESNFDHAAVSRKGAQGLMQLMPATALRFGVADAFDPSQNIHGGTRYLRILLDRFNGDPELALAAYNAGEGNVAKYKGVPPFRETVDYIRRIARYLTPDTATVASGTGAHQ